jgi:hypothetical protein
MMKIDVYAMLVILAGAVTVYVVIDQLLENYTFVLTATSQRIKGIFLNEKSFFHFK